MFGFGVSTSLSQSWNMSPRPACDVTHIAPSSADSATSSKSNWHCWHSLQHMHSSSGFYSWTSWLRLLIPADRPGLSPPPPRCISGPPRCILACTHSHVSQFLAVNTFKIFQCISIKTAFCHVKPCCALEKHTRLLFAFGKPIPNPNSNKCGISHL